MLGDMCAAWLRAWDDEEETELSETAMSTTESCLRCWRFLVALAKFNIMEMQEGEWEELAYMSKLASGASQNIEVLTALNVQESDFYKERLAKALSLQPAFIEASAILL